MKTLKVIGITSGILIIGFIGGFETAKHLCVKVLKDPAFRENVRKRTEEAFEQAIKKYEGE